MIDRQRILERLELMNHFLRQLKRLAAVDRRAFLMDPLASAAAESYLRRSLEAVFDIGRHILAKTGHVDLACEYKAIARGLVESGVVDQVLREPLTKMAGYRNRMVHFYHELTNEELYDVLQTSLVDIDSFIRNIRDYVLTDSSNTNTNS